MKAFNMSLSYSDNMNDSLRLNNLSKRTLFNLYYEINQVFLNRIVFMMRENSIRINQVKFHAMNKNQSVSTK